MNLYASAYMHLHFQNMKLIFLLPSSTSNRTPSAKFLDTRKQAWSMCQETTEELERGQELLKEEVNQLKNQMDLIIQVLLRRKDNPLSY
jgi:hypothetical protein